jgi:hypothetical protein
MGRGLRAGLLSCLVALGGGACHLIVSFDQQDQLAPVTDGAQPLPELCDDGIDNDGNGLIDCQDPACQPDHECVAEAPSGFSLAYVADGVQPACPGGPAPRQLYSQAAPTCDLSGCNCGPPGGSCAASAALYTTACMGGTATNVMMSAAMCYAGFPQSMSGSFTVSNDGVTCNATGAAGTTAAPPATQLSLCAVSTGAGGCGAGQVCVRRPPAGFGNVCAIAPGAQPCPTDRPQQRTAGDSFNDLRACSCGCSSVKSCANTQVSLYGNGSCNGFGGQNVTPTSKCMVFNGSVASMRLRNATPGPCQPSAVLTGVYTVVNEQTVCCPR